MDKIEANKRIDNLKREIKELEDIINSKESNEYKRSKVVQEFFDIFCKCKPVWHKDYPDSLYFIFNNKTYFEINGNLLYCNSEVWGAMGKHGKYDYWKEIINVALSNIGLNKSVVGTGNWEYTGDADYIGKILKLSPNDN